MEPHHTDVPADNPERFGQIKKSIDEKLDARLNPSKLIDFRPLMDVLATILQDGQITQSDYEAVVVYFEELFETHVRPFDIPGVGRIVEPVVDDAMKSLIRPTVKLLFERFVSDSNEPRVPDGVVE